MKKKLLIYMLSFGLVLSWSIVNAEDGFYVIPVKKNNYAPVEKTGQTICYDGSGGEIQCAGTAQDGEYQKGVTWPNPRFTDNDNGTVTDNLTGLIWLKDANCLGQELWSNALASSNSLANGQCGLSDGSVSGTWRLPNIRELQSLIDYSRTGLVLPNGNPFTGVQLDRYWSSTAFARNAGNAWYVAMGYGGAVGFYYKGNSYYVWPVRGGND